MSNKENITSLRILVGPKVSFDTYSVRVMVMGIGEFEDDIYSSVMLVSTIICIQIDNIITVFYISGRVGAVWLVKHVLTPVHPS